MISPPAVTDTARPVRRLCTSSTSTARQLLCPRRLHLKDHHLLKRVVEVAEAAEAKLLQLLIRNIGGIKHASIAARRVIHHQAA
jgi:hypothetical protein